MHAMSPGASGGEPGLPASPQALEENPHGKGNFAAAAPVWWCCSRSRGLLPPLPGLSQSQDPSQEWDATWDAVLLTLGTRALSCLLLFLSPSASQCHPKDAGHLTRLWDLVATWHKPHQWETLAAAGGLLCP